MTKLLTDHPFAKHFPRTFAAYSGPRGLKLAEAGEDIELEVYGVIASSAFWGDEITPGAVAEALRGKTGQLTVRINSPGGDAYAGIAIYNRLLEYSSVKGNSVTVKIDGLAASAASVVAMAGTEILMGNGAELMIHDAWTWAAGNADDLLKVAAELNGLSQNIASIYAIRSSEDAEQLRELMRAETYLGVDDAMAIKLADGTIVTAEDEEKDPSAETGEDPEMEDEEDPSAEDEEDGEDPSAEDEEEEEEDPSAEDEDTKALLRELGASNVKTALATIRAQKAFGIAPGNTGRAAQLNKYKEHIPPADYDMLMNASQAEVDAYLKVAKKVLRLGGTRNRRQRQPVVPAASGDIQVDVELTEDMQRSLERRGIKVDGAFAKLHKKVSSRTGAKVPNHA